MTDIVARLRASLLACQEQVQQDADEIEQLRSIIPHDYRPSMLHMGDCDICGNLPMSDLHPASLTAEIERLQDSILDWEKFARDVAVSGQQQKDEIERLRAEFKSIQQDWYAAFGAKWPMRPFPAMSDQP